MSERIPPDIAMWLATGERGISSESIVGAVIGVRIEQRPDVPYDPSDFRRCMLMLDACPSAVARFDAVRSISPLWAAFADAWPDLVALYREELPRHTGRAPKLYAAIRKIHDANRKTFMVQP